MTVNLLRVAAGVKNIDHLHEVIECHAFMHERLGHVMPLTTRNRPKRQSELLDDGSVYWIIKNMILARAKFLGFEEVQDEDGRSYITMFVSTDIVLTEPRQKRGFQGWRYLTVEDAPKDLDKSNKLKPDQDMPMEMVKELQSLGLL